MTDKPAKNLTATEIQERLKVPRPLPGDGLLRDIVDDHIALMKRLGLLTDKNPP